MGIKRSKFITIFEGPDGSGKTTAAKNFAELTGARYVHFGVLPLVTHGLARMYAEAMLPAVLGYQDVVLDRCWLSEKPYADARRSSKYRVDAVSIRMLERLAWRCSPVVIRCLPSIDVCLAAFKSRPEREYLARESELRSVHGSYSFDMATSLNQIDFDYTQPGAAEALPGDVIRMRHSRPHDLGILSSGNLAAPVVILGTEFADQKDTDPFYQWSFASFSGQGCSRWLTSQLESAGVSESSLAWSNLDQPSDLLADLVRCKQVVVLGNDALRVPDAVSNSAESVKRFYHPQYWKRFCFGQPYPLIQYLAEETGDERLNVC